MSGHNHADDGRSSFLSRRFDLPRFLHVHERDMCRDSDMPVGDVHCRTDMRRLGGDMFAQSDMRVLPVVYWHGNV